MLGTLHHIEINVSNLKKSRSFWEWLLSHMGYSLFQEWDQGFSFKLKDTYLVFVQTQVRFMDSNYHRAKVGLNHLAFHAASMEQIDELTEHLKNNNIPILYPQRHPFAGGDGHYAVFFEDPDRIKVEVAFTMNHILK